MTPNNNADIIEIFSSIQGEGPYIGYKQLFLRFAGCNLCCNYCDTNFIANKSYSVCNGKEFEQQSNPISVNNLVKQTLDFYKNGFHSISLTGGEPLLSAEFVNSYINELKSKISTEYYLETNGTKPDLLEKVINNLDFISMDIKIESSTGQKPLYEANSKFVEVAKKHNKEIFAKVVMTSQASDEEIVRVAELCRFHKIPLIVQPVTTSFENLVLTSDKMNYIIDLIIQKHNNVRLIPQTHTFLGLL